MSVTRELFAFANKIPENTFGCDNTCAISVYFSHNAEEFRTRRVRRKLQALQDEHHDELAQKNAQVSVF